MSLQLIHPTLVGVDQTSSVEDQASLEVVVAPIAMVTMMVDLFMVEVATDPQLEPLPEDQPRLLLEASFLASKTSYLAKLAISSMML